MASGHSDTAALKVEDKLEVIAIIGENAVVRNEIGSLYAPRGPWS